MLRKRDIMKMIISAVVIVGCIGGALYIKYSGGPRNGSAAIMLPLSSTPPTMNPLYANSNSSLMVTDALYEPLYNINQNGTIEFNTLAENITHSKDCKTYILTLKPDLKWSDGKPLTANDIVFTFNTIMNPKNNALIMQTFMIDGKPVTIKKINDTTVQFDLPAPSLGFEQNLASLYPIPEHIYSGVSDIKNAEQNKKPVGDGPYMFAQEQAGSYVNLVKNPNYKSGPEAKTDRIVFKVIPNADAGLAALESNQLTAGYVSQNIVNNQKIKDNFNISQFGSGLVNTVVFNFNNKALSNLKVREAISYALNRDALTKAEYGDTKYAKAAYSVFSPETQYYDNNGVVKYNYDLNKAKELMNESGEKDVTLRLAYAAGFKWAENQALIIQKDLAQIGIKVDLKPVELNAFFQEIFTPNSHAYDMAINGYNMGNTPDGYSTVFTTNGANNASNFSNPEIDKLFNEAQASTSMQQRENLYKEIQVKLSQLIPLYTINYPDTLIAISKDVDGVKEAQPAPISMFSNLGALYYQK